MTAQSAGHEPMSTSGWQLTPRCYNTSYRVAAFRALIIALILAAGLAFLILVYLPAGTPAISHTFGNQIGDACVLAARCAIEQG